MIFGELDVIIRFEIFGMMFGIDMSLFDIGKILGLLYFSAITRTIFLALSRSVHSNLHASLGLMARAAFLKAKFGSI